MLPAVSNRLTRPEPIQYHELLVEHCDTLLHSARLAEGGEFLWHTTEPDFEDHAPSAKEVQARQRIGNDLPAATRQRADGEPQLQKRGGARNRGQDNTWIPRRHARTKPR